MRRFCADVPDLQLIVLAKLPEAVEAGGNGAQQPSFVEGLGEVVVGSRLHATAQVGALSFGGEEAEGGCP